SFLAAPGRSELVVVLHHILIASVHRQLIGAPRAADCRLKPRIRRDYIVGKDASVAPAADPQAVRVGDPFGNCPVNTRFEIGYLLVAPVGEDAASELSAATVAAAIVDGQNDIAVCGEYLTFHLQRIQTERQSMIVLTVWTSVNPNDQRMLFGRVV